MRDYTAPMLVDGLNTPGQLCHALDSAPLRAGEGVAYNEAWLQELIQAHPALLPVEAIEPGLAGPQPVCMELPVPSGFIDNLMITPSGGLVVVETKLWRNPEARRAVVGQVLDYAKDLSRFSYEDLERAVQVARREPRARLFPLVQPEAAPEEETSFVDAVSRNLRLGRMLLIVAGDGIREGAEQLAEFLQRHLGLHFTLAMVEMALWRLPGEGRVLVQPRVLARTVQIERAVVRLEQGVTIKTAQIEPAAAKAGRPTTLTEESYYERLAQSDRSLPDALKAFLEEVEPLGIYGRVGRNLSLKLRTEGGEEFTLGVVDHEGRLVTDYVNGPANAIGRLNAAHRYQRVLAAVVPDARVNADANPFIKPLGWRVVGSDGKTNIPVAAFLEQKDVWIEAMTHYGASLTCAE